MKFGAEFRAGANDEIRDRGSSGSFTFTPLITSNSGAPDTGNALASFLLGEVNAASVRLSDLLQTRAAYWAMYAQDDWRPTDRTTLSYGLRCEAELPRREVHNKMNSFDLTAVNPVSGTPGVVTFAGVNGTLEQIHSIARALPKTRLLAIPKCGHSAHRDQPDALIEATRQFVVNTGASE